MNPPTTTIWHGTIIVKKDEVIRIFPFLRSLVELLRSKSFPHFCVAWGLKKSDRERGVMPTISLVRINFQLPISLEDTWEWDIRNGGVFGTLLIIPTGQHILWQHPYIIDWQNWSIVKWKANKFVLNQKEAIFGNAPRCDQLGGSWAVCYFAIQDAGILTLGLGIEQGWAKGQLSLLTVIQLEPFVCKEEIKPPTNKIKLYLCLKSCSWRIGIMAWPY